MGWQWHQLDNMQIICTLLQTDNHASTSPLRIAYITIYNFFYTRKKREEKITNLDCNSTCMLLLWTSTTAIYFSKAGHSFNVIQPAPSDSFDL